MKKIKLFFFIPFLFFSQEKEPISSIEKPYTTIFLNLDDISLKGKNPNLAFFSLAIPGLGTSIVTDGEKGKKKIKGSLSVLAVGVLSKIISDNSYEKYQKSTDYSSGDTNADSRIENLYNTANFANNVFLYSVTFYLTLGIHDALRTFLKAKKEKEKRKKLKNL